MFDLKGIFLETGVERIIQAVSDAIESALGVTLLDIVIQILATVVLVLIVRFFLWNKITAFLDQRKQFLTSEVDNAKNANAEALALKEKTEQEYMHLKEKSKQMLDSAKQKALEEQNLIIQGAKREATQIIDDSKKEIEVEKEKARIQMKEEVIDLAVLMAEKIIEQEVDTDQYLNKSIDRLDRSETK